MRTDFLMKKAGITNIEEDDELMRWCERIDYFEYENQWKDNSTNVFKGRLEELRNNVETKVASILSPVPEPSINVSANLDSLDEMIM